MGRALACLLLGAALAAAEEESRLGTLIRWHLREPSPARRQDFLESIERLAGGDPAVVAEAIRRGEHFEHAERPVLRRGGKHPVFDARRPEVADVSACAGDFAELHLPEGYTPATPHPLILELSRTGLETPPGAILVRVNVHAHAQARELIGAADLLVISLLRHLFDVVHVDPGRVFLHGGDEIGATLAWYVALHHPDRFAGVLGALGAWPDGATLAPNASVFTALGIESYRGDRAMEAFLGALREHNPAHLHLRARATNQENDLVLRPTIRKWWSETVRPPAPASLHLVTDRGMPVRSHWLRVVPRVPSVKAESVRHWKHYVTARPAVCEAELKPGNLVEIKTSRVAAFDLFIDPTRVDPGSVLRVRINGRVPEARVIHLEIADLLEDYRQRRDTRLLYACRLTFGGR